MLQLVRRIKLVNMRMIKLEGMIALVKMMKLVKVMNPVKQMRIIKLGRMMILVMMLKLVNKLGVSCAELSLGRLGKDSLGKRR